MEPTRESSDQSVTPEVLDAETAPAAQPSERERSTTVGTGSYIAVSCSVIALLVTFAILGLLFLLRWL